MVICSTPDCGIPGRPFPACAVCKLRAYCGSRCLVVIQEDKLLTSDGPEGSKTLMVKRGDSVCPPCFQKWFSEESGPEEFDDDNAEERGDTEYIGDGKGLAG